MENELKFHETLSLDGFKQNVGGDTQLDVIENPSTNKLFFACGRVSGAVAKEIDYESTVVVSRVSGEDGEPFWMLHNKKLDNVKKTL